MANVMRREMLADILNEISLSKPGHGRPQRRTLLAFTMIEVMVAGDGDTALFSSRSSAA